MQKLSRQHVSSPHEVHNWDYTPRFLLSQATFNSGVDTSFCSLIVPSENVTETRNQTEAFQGITALKTKTLQDNKHPAGINPVNLADWVTEFTEKNIQALKTLTETYSAHFQVKNQVSSTVALFL